MMAVECLRSMHQIAPMARNRKGFVDKFVFDALANDQSNTVLRWVKPRIEQVMVFLSI